MTWEDRLKEAAYTSANGERMEFLYENIAFSFEKKGSAFNFPDADGTYVQDTGVSGKKFPLNVIFSGPDHDIEAKRFEKLVTESGVGKLETPLFDTINVIPNGAVTFNNGFVSGANETSIQITFVETTGLVYPSNETDRFSGVFKNY